MALVLVLITSALLMVCVGAFLSVQKGNFSLMSGAQEQRQAYQAALTGLAYVRMRLEGNSNYGTASLSSTPSLVTNTVPLQVVESRTNVIGVLSGGAHFQVMFEGPAGTSSAWYDDADIASHPNQPSNWLSYPAAALISYNNLSSPTGQPPRRPVQATRVVPAASANLQVVGYCNGAKKRLDVTLGKAQFAQGSFLAEQSVLVKLKSGAPGARWNLSSQTSSRNQVRSGGKIFAPPSSQLIFVGSSADNGALVATDNIHLGGNPHYVVQSNSGEVTSLSPSGGTAIGDGLNDDSEAQTASTNSKGSYLYHSSAQGQIPQLSVSQMDKGSTNKVVLPGGRYFLAQEGVVRYWSDVNHDPTSDPTGWQKEFHGQLTDSTGTVAAFIAGNQLRFPSGTSLELNSDSHFSGAEFLSVGLGYTGSGDIPSGASAALRSKGNLQVDGEVVGSGAVVAQKKGSSQGNLSISGKSALSSSLDNGVALYSEGATHLTAVPSQFENQSSRVLDADWPVFRGSLKRYSNDSRKMADWTSSSWAGMDGFDNWAQWPYKPQDTVPNTHMWVIGANEHHPVAAGPGMGTGGNADLTLRSCLIDDWATVRPQLLSQFPIYNTNTAVRNAFDQAEALWNSGQPFGGQPGVALGHYVRLREFLRRSTAHPADVATLSADWLDVNNLQPEVGKLVEQQISYYGQLATRNGQSLSVLVDDTTPPTQGWSPSDIDLKGLVYSGRSFLANLLGHRFHLEGSLLAKTHIVIDDASAVDSTYAPSYLEAILGQGSSTPLSELFWSVH